jgi:aspartyl-tRNA(Asn)/glutamyl-tRNA(Gln) amidotransferase subunit C
MIMQITDETIDYVGILAKLELSAEEKEQAKKDMTNMLDYVGKLNELDTDGVEPMSHTFSVHNVFREDVVVNGDDRENMLANAPEKKDGAYKVPRTFD